MADHRQKYDTQRTADETQEATTKDEFRSLLYLEYDLTDRFYAFALGGSERDRIRQIEIRAYPNGGIGRRFYDSDAFLLQGGLGLAYVWEEFIGFPDNNYGAWVLTAEYRWRMPFGPLLSGRLNYMPEFQRGEEWLFRSETNLDVPITELLSLRLRVTDVSDNNPAPNVGNNKITTNLTLAVNFPLSPPRRPPQARWPCHEWTCMTAQACSSMPPVPDERACSNHQEIRSTS